MDRYRRCKTISTADVHFTAPTEPGPETPQTLKKKKKTFSIVMENPRCSSCNMSIVVPHIYSPSNSACLRAGVILPCKFFSLPFHSLSPVFDLSKFTSFVFASTSVVQVEENQSGVQYISVPVCSTMLRTEQSTYVTLCFLFTKQAFAASCAVRTMNIRMLKLPEVYFRPNLSLFVPMLSCP